jgi:competence ComEA-like helix-hairpin-helix protein
MLNRAEKAAIAAAVCVVILLSGYLIGQGQTSGSFTVVTDKGAAYIKPDEAAAADEGGGEAATQPVFPININTAGADELALLPGIGPSLADRIILYREENGVYGLEAEIMNVKGIGVQKYNDIKDKITVGGGDVE